MTTKRFRFVNNSCQKQLQKIEYGKSQQLTKTKAIYLTKTESEMINLLKSKIQELIVSESSLEYPGSISLPPALVEAANLHEFEQVFVNNKTTGARISTYVVISKEPGFVTLNGAASHHFKKGDCIHVLSFRLVNEVDVKHLRPTLVRANSNNEVVEAIPYFI